MYNEKRVLKGGILTMKKCNNCSKEYDDSKMFCPLCGGQLTPVAPPPTPASNASPSFFENWGGVLLAVIGLIIAWEVHAVFGFALAVLGLIWGWSSPNKINKILSAVVGGITILLFIWYILA